MAEALLLWLWGRIDIAGGELAVDGDRTVVTRRNAVSAHVVTSSPGRRPPPHMCNWAAT